LSTILVTDGEQRSALAVVRSLGRAGYRVVVAARGRRSLAGASRWAAANVITPDPLADPSAFVEAVANAIAAHEARIVIPVTDASALTLLACRQRLAPAIIPMPEVTTFQRISDKGALREHAERAGLAFPPQHDVRDVAEARALAATLRYPIVLKPSRSVGEANGARVKMSVRHASGPAALEAHLDTLPAQAYPLLLQQRIVGPGVGVFVLRWNGERVATFMHQRLREKPPSGGVSVYAESVAPDADLIARAASLLDDFDWSGVAMVECKVDRATGTPYLMEVNGRFWGSLQLAIDAGVDFPVLLVRLALGESVRGPDQYRAGLGGRWWWGEVDHVLARLRRSNAALALPSDAPGRARAVVDFLGSCLRFAPDQVFRLSDPMPFFLESVRWLARSA
jgi:predicted ATP-grasp superfamily ATP-dependent carboligase